MTAVAAATAAVPRLYAIGSVPATPTYPYGVYSAVLGRGEEPYPLDSRTIMRNGRVTAQTFAHTATAALDLMDAITARLLDVGLDVAGYECTPCRIELDPVVIRDPDDSGVVGVTATFTFTATKES